MKGREWNVVRPLAFLTFLIASISMSGCEISRSPKPGSSAVSQDINASHDARVDCDIARASRTRFAVARRER